MEKMVTTDDGTEDSVSMFPKVTNAQKYKKLSYTW